MKKFCDLVAKTMSAESQENARRKTEAMLVELALDELRTALSLTQQRLAKDLGVKQSSLSKVLHGKDMYISTLDRLVKGMGGDLEVHVILGNGRVKLDLKQFRGAKEKKKSPRKLARSRSAARKAS